MADSTNIVHGGPEVTKSNKGPVDISWFSKAKLTLVDSSDPSNRMRAQFNPETLGLGMRAETGKLNPVGSSYATQQYSHTEADDFSLVLVFDHIAMALEMEDRKVPIHDINFPADWLTSFTIPRGPGIAPPPLIILWPKTVSTLVGVKSAKTLFELFFSNGQPRALVVTMDCCELRRTERAFASHMQRGWNTFEPGVSLNGLSRNYPLGAPPSRVKITLGASRRAK